MVALTPFFSFSCPSCGGQGSAYSASSVLLVCEYCRSTLVRSGEGVEDTGKKSARIEDFSPLQIYSSGVYQGTPFTVIGMLYIKYPRGSWREWYVLFADGSNGWLGDFSGQYVMTRLSKPLRHPLPFKDLVAGSSLVEVGGNKFIASDIRRATSVKTSASGELPFILQANEEIFVADFRYRNQFMTLDYNEGSDIPLVYLGKAVTLPDMRCQNLRTNDQIKATAGKLRGQRVSLACPQCGAPLAWYPDIAQNIVCPSCQSKINLDEGKAQVMQAHKMRKAQQESATLKLGEIAQIGGNYWTLIGMMRVQETPPENAKHYIQGGAFKKSYEPSSWREYLLYNQQKGFTWLVEADKKWDISHSPDTWPETKVLGGRKVVIDSGTNKALAHLYSYGGEVQYAAGAFYWDVEPGDVTYYEDFSFGQGKMGASTTREEYDWSVSKPVSGDDLARWFKRPELKKAVSSASFGGGLGDRANMIFTVYCVLNAPVILMSAFGEDSQLSFFWILIATYIVYLALFQGREDD